MKHIYLFFGILFSLSSIAQGGKSKDLKFDYSGKKIDGSPYAKIIFLDNREEKKSFGTVRIGRLNKEVPVVCNPSFSDGLNSLFDSLLVNKNGEAELLFQLRQLKLVERTESKSEMGYAFFRANTYSKLGDKYYLLDMIDTFVVVADYEDITEKLLDVAALTVSQFLRKSLNKTLNINNEITYTGICKIDSIEKASLRLYNTSTFVDGIYNNFLTFRNQNPDYSLYSITFEDGDIQNIKGKNRRGRVKRIKSKNIYAIVNKGVPYISAEFGFYPLVKKQNDFYFVGDGKVSPAKTRVVITNSVFGITEYEALVPLTSMFEIKVDHLNGKFMRVREIKE